MPSLNPSRPPPLLRFLPIQLDIAIMLLFFTYFMIPLTLRVATTLSAILSIIHLLVSTTVAIDTTPADILGRQVGFISVHVLGFMS